MKIYQVIVHKIFKIIFYLKVIWAEGSKLVPPQTVPAGVPYYQLTLSPPVILHNYLPYNIQYSLEVSCLSLKQHSSRWSSCMDIFKMKAKGCIMHVITKHNTNTNKLYITLISYNHVLL